MSIEQFDEKSSFEQLYEIAPLELQKRMEAIPDDILEKTDKDILNKLRLDDRVILRRLRLALWSEADRVFNAATKLNMRLSSVYDGLCDRKYFNKKVLGNSFNLAFLCRRPHDYNVLMTELLEYGLHLNREILELDHVDEEGKLNTKLLDIKLKIIENTHNRLKGTPVSRTQVHTINSKQSSQSLDYSQASNKELLEEIKKIKEGES